MKKIALLSLMALASGCANVSRMVGGTQDDASIAANQFELIKMLEGEWTGEGHFGDESMPAETRFRVTAAGSTVEETLAPGSPHEMVTMYHLDNGRLMLTHYCAAGNQPRMVARPENFVGTSATIRFEFTGATNLSKPTDGHMHEAVITIEGKDKLTAKWTYYEGGKASHTAVFELKRKPATKVTQAFSGAF